jgi:hypothetical protein
MNPEVEDRPSIRTMLARRHPIVPGAEVLLNPFFGQASSSRGPGFFFVDQAFVGFH